MEGSAGRGGSVIPDARDPGLTVHVLGSGSGRPTARRDTTALLIDAPDGWTLVECPGSIVHRLASRGVDLAALRRLILTHNHVDHIYGFAHLVHAMAVQGNCPPLRLYAPEQTLVTLRRVVAAFALEGPRYPSLSMTRIVLQADAELLDEAGTTIRTTPASHGRDTVTIRFEAMGMALGYSSDTRPSDGVSSLCRGVDFLFHDCGGLHASAAEFGDQHSSARQAGEVAAQAQARQLGLIHLSPAAEQDEAALVAEAQGAFDGSIRVCQDGDVLPLRPGRKRGAAGDAVL